MDVEMGAGKNQRQQITTLIVTLLVVLLMILLLARRMAEVSAFIGESGWVGLVVAVLIYAILGASPIPSEPLTVLLSTVYGPFSAMLVSGVGNLLAALLEYFIGERIGCAAGFEARRAKLPFGLGRLPVDSPTFLIAARMLPGYGPKFVSLMGGIYRVPFYRYLWTAALPTFAGSAIFAYGGFGLLQLSGWH